MTKHFHTLEIVFVAGLSAAITFHTMRFAGAKLAKSKSEGVAKFGRALAGTFTFGSPQ